MAGSGWNLNWEGVQRFSLPSQRDKESRIDSSGRTTTILLVEDNPADANLVREALEEHDVECELLLITNGQKAIEFIQQVDTELAPPLDLVILDLNLPMKPGSRVLEHLRASSRCPLVPIIVLSSSDSHKDREEAAKFGASRYYKKPTRLMEFLRLGGIFKQMLTSIS